MISAPGIVRRAWYRWKALKLPWRKQFLIGFDLAGNTFWEFKDALNANRLRRIVKYKSSTVHYADLQISPQWHQWLRHTRQQSPTLDEQRYDLERKAMLKHLADEADRRWKSLPSYLDAPDGLGRTAEAEQQDDMVVDGPPGAQHESCSGAAKQVQRKGNPGDDWQPKPWQPTGVRRDT